MSRTGRYRKDGTPVRYLTRRKVLAWCARMTAEFSDERLLTAPSIGDYDSPIDNATENTDMNLATIETPNSKHAYDVEVGNGKFEGYVTVHCNNRAQAARLAERAGYVVRSVNMVG